MSPGLDARVQTAVRLLAQHWAPPSSAGIIVPARRDPAGATPGRRAADQSRTPQEAFARGRARRRTAARSAGSRRWRGKPLSMAAPPRERQRQADNRLENLSSCARTATAQTETTAAGTGIERTLAGETDSRLAQDAQRDATMKPPPERDRRVSALLPCAVDEWRLRSILVLAAGFVAASRSALPAVAGATTARPRSIASVPTETQRRAVQGRLHPPRPTPSARRRTPPSRSSSTSRPGPERGRRRSPTCGRAWPTSMKDLGLARRGPNHRRGVHRRATRPGGRRARRSPSPSSAARTPPRGRGGARRPPSRTGRRPRRPPTASRSAAQRPPAPPRRRPPPAEQPAPPEQRRHASHPSARAGSPRGPRQPRRRHTAPGAAAARAALPAVGA